MLGFLFLHKVSLFGLGWPLSQVLRLRECTTMSSYNKNAFEDLKDRDWRVGSVMRNTSCCKGLVGLSPSPK